MSERFFTPTELENLHISKPHIYGMITCVDDRIRVNGVEVPHYHHNILLGGFHLDKTHDKDREVFDQVMHIINGEPFKKTFKKGVELVKRDSFLNSFTAVDLPIYKDYIEKTVAVEGKLKGKLISMTFTQHEEYIEVDKDDAYLFDTLIIEKFNDTSSGIEDYKGTFYTKGSKCIKFRSFSTPRRHSGVLHEGFLKTVKYRSKYTIPSYNSLQDMEG